ncbi:Uncharacterised protein [Mycobacteroides abscessus subsp. abscessus]|nr:Uncharacterised protein [Mycobacteroides abscessus subsp. abscessus]
MRTDLVESALSMAVALRGALPAQVIFHADSVSCFPGELACGDLVPKLSFLGPWMTRCSRRPHRCSPGNLAHPI